MVLLLPYVGSGDPAQVTRVRQQVLHLITILLAPGEKISVVNKGWGLGGGRMFKIATDEKESVHHS